MSFTRYTMIYIDIFHSLTLTGPHPMSIALQYTVSTSRLKVLSFPPVSRRLRCESNTTLEFLVWVVYPRRHIYIPIDDDRYAYSIHMYVYIYISKPRNTMCRSHWSHAGNINLRIWMNYHTHTQFDISWVSWGLYEPSVGSNWLGLSRCSEMCMWVQVCSHQKQKLFQTSITQRCMFLIPYKGFLKWR
jgi:hypothetical protein